MAPWHTRTVYGVRVADGSVRSPGEVCTCGAVGEREAADGSVRSPGEVCTPELAARALLLAARSLTASEAFLAGWRPPGE